MRFGLFIHWGPVSLTGHEIGWSRRQQTPVDEYDNLYMRFNPVDFNADEWVRTAEAAGMKYVVITTKHHDGFCLWPSDVTGYDIAATPFKRDVLAELSAACRKQGLLARSGSWKTPEIGQVFIDERNWNHVRKFEVQVKQDDAWQTVLEGMTIGRNFLRDIPPVTSRYVRLNILEATDGPTLWEFQVRGVGGG